MTLAVVLAANLWFPLRAEAFVFFTHCTPPKVIHWPSESCIYDECAITQVPFTDLCSETNSATEEAAAAWAFWMWCREGALTTQLFWKQEVCESDTPWFGPSADTDSSFNFENITPLGTFASAVSCSSHAHITRADIKVDNELAHFDPGGEVLDSLADCLNLAPYKEDTFGHEVGHSYGLDHNDSMPCLMSGTGETHMCNKGSYLHGQPHADDLGGAATVMGRNVAFRENLAGMAFFEGGQGEELLTEYTNMSFCGGSITVSYTIMNYYAPLGSGTFKHRVVLVPEQDNPDAGDVVWGSTATKSGSIPSAATFFVTRTVSPNHAVLAPNQIYRMWVFMDPQNGYIESDEADNWFPLAVTLKRGTGC